MDLISKIREKAIAQGKHIVLPEGTEKRTVKAAEIITKEKIAKITLLGCPEEVAKVAAEVGADLTGVEIVDPTKSPDFDDFAATFCKMREKKRA